MSADELFSDGRRYAIRTLPAPHSLVCKVRGCSLRAGFTVYWRTGRGATGSDRCIGHAEAFAKRAGIPMPQASLRFVSVKISVDAESLKKKLGAALGEPSENPDGPDEFPDGTLVRRAGQP